MVVLTQIIRSAASAAGMGKALNIVALLKETSLIRMLGQPLKIITMLLLLATWLLVGKNAMYLKSTTTGEQILKIGNAKNYRLNITLNYYIPAN